MVCIILLFIMFFPCFGSQPAGNTSNISEAQGRLSRQVLAFFEIGEKDAPDFLNDQRGLPQEWLERTTNSDTILSR
jgi:hypothetical protein